MKIGFFGGSFNPPTNAHIALAKKALEECYLDKVIFVPMSDFYEKENLAKVKDRLEMLKIACFQEKKLEVSDIETNINKKLTAIEAFRIIEKKYLSSDNYFLMGADNFINILKWKESKELIEKYKYIVFERENIDLIKYIKENFSKKKINVIIIKNDNYKEVSASKFRNLFDEDILPQKVLQYIKENEIY